MQSHARVVIIGGGMMGVGLLYHLAEFGWDDCVLIEMWRKEYNTIRPHSSLGYQPPAPAAIVVQLTQLHPAGLT